MHIRQTIRDELRTRATGLPGQIGAPFDSVEIAANSAEIPAAVVSLITESVEDVRHSSTALEKATRRLTASLVLVAKRPDDLEGMAEALEIAMVPDLAPGIRHELTVTRFQDPERGESDLFSLALVYEIFYTVLDGVPSVIAS